MEKTTLDEAINRFIEEIKKANVEKIRAAGYKTGGYKGKILFFAPDNALSKKEMIAKLTWHYKNFEEANELRKYISQAIKDGTKTKRIIGGREEEIPGLTIYYRG